MLTSRAAITAVHPQNSFHLVKTGTVPVSLPVAPGDLRPVFCLHDFDYSNCFIYIVFVLL